MIIQKKINSRFEVKIKRGCSEFEASYPKYNAKSELSSKKFKYQNEWRVIERNFDEKVERKQKIFGFKTKNGVHLEDILIIQNWMSYAIGLGATQLESQFPFLKINENFYKFGFSRRKFI